jgi:hypothetical protein
MDVSHGRAPGLCDFHHRCAYRALSRGAHVQTTECSLLPSLTVQRVLHLARRLPLTCGGSTYLCHDVYVQMMCEP